MQPAEKTPSRTAAGTDFFRSDSTPPTRNPPNAEQQDRQELTHSTPLVDGMPCTRGSGSTACRSALAIALYCASQMWCGSRP